MATRIAVALSVVVGLSGFSAAMDNGPAAQTASAKVLKMAVWEDGLIQEVNRQRAAHGLAPLTADPWLLHAARHHTAWMTRNENLTHTDQGVAENIAMGQRTVGDAVADWMNSPGHRANILGREYTRIGAAAYTSQSGTSYWCLQFLP